MNMANMDHRGGIRGTVRGANNAPVADTAVTAVDAATGARFEAMTTRRARTPSRALPVGSYNVTVVSAGLTAFRRQGVAVAADQTVQLDITLDAASAQQAADAERQELLQQVADTEATRHRPRDRTRCSPIRKRASAASRCSSTRTAHEHDEQVPGRSRR